MNYFEKKTEYGCTNFIIPSTTESIIAGIVANTAAIAFPNISIIYPIPYNIPTTVNPTKAIANKIGIANEADKPNFVNGA